MNAAVDDIREDRVGAFEPLREPVFRRIWSASVLANFGQLILGVGAAWEMTRLTDSPTMVALVQTAMMLPLMLIAVPAGAIADMFDRRKIAMLGLGFSMFCAALLTLLAWLGFASPWVLLAFCFLIGGGVALYSPSWQASIGEQVKPAQLPAAIALGSISYNVARSFGPAIGGLIVLAAGAKTAFGLNSIFYLPLILAFFFWNRRHISSLLPPERIDRAIVSGARYASHSGPIRSVLVRSLLFGLAGATASALAPLIAKDLLGGDASIYGILLGASGVGAVAGALLVNRFNMWLGIETSTRIMAVVGGLGIVLVGLSRSLPLTCFGLFVAGGANMLTIALYNISVQLAAPRWVIARALSLFSASLTGGIALGAWFWGVAAGIWSVDTAIIVSGFLLAGLPLVYYFLPLPQPNVSGAEPVILIHEPEVDLKLSMRSGPIVIEVDYRIDPSDARAFYDAMLRVQKTRLRNGGFNWSIARNIADAAIWTERYHFPTWGDYLRTRDRFTQSDVDEQAKADAFLQEGALKSVRRWLDRPFGSVRWRADSPQTSPDTIGYLGP